MQQLTPPENLHDRIIEQIRQKELLRLRRRLILFAWIFGGSAVVFWLGSELFFEQIRVSSFMDLIRLANGNLLDVLADFKDYALSLIEALPVLSGALLFAGFGVMSASIYKVIKYFKQIKNLGAIR